MEISLHPYNIYNNNNNNNNHDDIYSAVIIAETYRNGARWPPTFGPSPPIGSHFLLSPFIYYSAQKLILILPSCGG